MKRITGTNQTNLDAQTAAEAWQRLQAYEDLQEDLEQEQQALAAQLQEMREAGKEKTATYRDMLTRKLQNAYVLGLFMSRGL